MAPSVIHTAPSPLKMLFCSLGLQSFKILLSTATARNGPEPGRKPQVLQASKWLLSRVEESQDNNSLKHHYNCCCQTSWQGDTCRYC